jgi:acetolactate synthase small subunit
MAHDTTEARMKRRAAQTAPNQQLDFQIRAAVRVAHVMMNEQETSDENLLKLVKASRQVEDSQDMHQAMAFAVCAAQKSKQPV